MLSYVGFREGRSEIKEIFPRSLPLLEKGEGGCRKFSNIKPLSFLFKLFSESIKNDFSSSFANKFRAQKKVFLLSPSSRLQKTACPFSERRNFWLFFVSVFRLGVTPWERAWGRKSLLLSFRCEKGEAGREREREEREKLFFLVGRPNSCLMHGRFPPRPFPDGREEGEGEGGRFPGGQQQRRRENGCCVNTRGVPFTSRAGQKKVGSVLYFPAV